MSECDHGMRIQTWRFEDGKPAGMWSCVECGRKFVPLGSDTDCRTCRHYREGLCHSTLRCIDGVAYQRTSPVRIWETLPTQQGEKP